MTGRFVKGGGGRPRGSRNKATAQCDELLDGEAEIITRKCIELAKAGDPTALKLCVERVIPLRKGRALQGFVKRKGEGSAEAILRGVLEGEITPSEGGEVISLIESTARVEVARALAEMRQHQLEAFKAASAKGLNAGVMLVPLGATPEDWEAQTIEAQKLLKAKVRE